MPQLRAEQLQNDSLTNLQVAVNAAIAQSKIADHIADPTGWISKGTVTTVESYETFSGGSQGFGFNGLTGSEDTGLEADRIYNFKINGKNYQLNTAGQSTPITFTELASLMNALVTSDNLSVSVTGGDLLVESTETGYDATVSIDLYPPRHRLHDYLNGFTSFGTSTAGGGVTWQPTMAGRLFYAKDTDELRIATAIDPYYQAIGNAQGWEGNITTLAGSSASNWPTTPLQYDAGTDFEIDGSNLFVYLNGVLLEYRSDGTADYQIVDTNTIRLNGNLNIEATDKITILVYENSSMSVYATRSYVDNKFTGEVSLSGNVTFDGDILTNQNSVHDIGSETHTFQNLYLGDSIYFKPIGTGDNLRIYRNVTGNDTQLRIQIGTGTADQVVFEDEGNTTIMSLDGDGNVSIPGDLTVSGTTTYVNETNSEVTDADYVIKNETPAADGDASYQVARASGNVALRWNDSVDRWQATYGSAADITSNLLTENDLSSGLNLDARYLRITNLTDALGSDVSAVKFNGTTAAAGTFYGGNTDPSNTTRLNYDGNLYVKELYADDIHASASSIYIGGILLSDDGGRLAISHDGGNTFKDVVEELPTEQYAVMRAASSTAEGAVQFMGNVKTEGSFYSGTADPTGSTRLNFDGDIYLRDLHARDVHVSASTLYVNGKPVIEDVSNTMTFQTDPDQDIKIQTQGTTGDLQFISSNDIGATADGHLDFSVTAVNSGKNLTFSNQSDSGEIQFFATGSGSAIEFQTGGGGVVSIDTAASTPTGTGRINIDAKVYSTEFVGPLAGNADTATNATSADQVRGVNFHTGTTDPTGTTRLNMDGYLYASRVYNAVWNDLAEFMPASEPAQAGQVLVMTEKGLAPSKRRADKATVGVYSDTYGYALGADNQSGKHPVGLSGRVDVMVKESIEIGDLLVSDIGGFASKASSEEAMIPGIIIGKALQRKTTEGVERISMLIMNR